MERLSPSFHCPWLSVVAVWWSLVRFRRAIFFCFLANLLFWGADRRVTRDFGGVEKATVGDMPIGL